jgi:Flp pilus assembly protein CpaB
VGKKQKQILLAVVLAVIVAVINKYYVDSRISAYRDKKMVTVMRTTRAIPAGGELTRDMVEKVAVPDNYAPRTRIRDVDLPQWLGQKLAIEVAKEDYVLSSYFTPIMTVGRKLSDQLSGQQDYRAISIPVDDTNSLARSILPGDKVDVLFSFNIPPLRQKFSTVLLQNVPIIATGGYSASEQELGTTSGRAKQYSTITLRLSALDAMRLTYARHEGRISIALRYSGDNNIISIPPIGTVEDLLSASDKEMLKIAQREQQKSTEQQDDAFREQIKSVMDQQRQQKTHATVGGKE